MGLAAQSGHDSPVNRMDLSRVGSVICAATLLWLGPSNALAEGLTGSQRDAANQYFEALGSGDAQALTFAIHPDEIIKLRTRLMGLLREEARHADGTLRSRLFGAATQLAELEHLTAPSFFAVLLRRVSLSGREFQSVNYVGSISEHNSLVWAIGRLKPRKDRGKEEVVQMVGLIPYGKDWKAIVPTEMLAQIEDMLDARSNANALIVPRNAQSHPAGDAAGNPAASHSAAPREVLALLDSAEQALIAGNCDTYYHDYMSPNFRKQTPAKAFESLVASCKNSMGMRETMISTLRIVRTLTPQLELEATRASYDVSNEGLPYDRFTLEKIKDRWFIAE